MLNPEDGNLKGNKIENATDLFSSASKVFLQGNIGMLTQYFQQFTGKQDTKVAFFGAHDLLDDHAVHDFD
jgi:hypothetical protein